MSPELEDLLNQFDEAYYGAFEAWRDADQSPSLGEYEALAVAAQAARQILEHIGLVDPFECGTCPACIANKAANAAEVRAAVETDPDLSPTVHGKALTEAEESAAERLLREVFGDHHGEASA